jgi:type II secretory pathway component PulJ
MTLVELLVSLTILAILSTAVTVMLRAGGQASSALGASMTNQWEVQTALSRIVQQSRMCTTLTVPTGVSGGSTFSLVTEPDTLNNSATYAVTYSLITASDGTKQLQEADARYGNSILLHNVQSFDVRTKNIGAPQVVILTLTVGSTPPVTRTVRITPRNQ